LTRAGIEDLNVYAGRAFLDVGKLAQARGLDAYRFQNLLMKRKSVALNFEDPVSFAVNAGKPIVDRLSEDRKRRIELLVICTESGIDFGKAMGTYVHQALGLSRNCRNFEVKHACFAGTAGLQTAASFVAANTSPGALALVITTDVARPIPHTYVEPSQGAAAVAMLVSDHPAVFELDLGANGCYSYEVMDTCRPTAEIETGDPDLSLLSYLDCLENSFQAYSQKAGGVDVQQHFDYLAFHTPFGGMVKGAHRTLLRKLKRLPPPLIDEDFARRMLPSLVYCQQVGNIYSGTVFLALAGVIDTAAFDRQRRIGVFSYGSGCCSEFYSGTAGPQSQQALASQEIGKRLTGRHELSMPEYEDLTGLNRGLAFGCKDFESDFDSFRHIYRSHYEGANLLVLQKISGYHREYRWS
jgi:polyketide biosynthesis 3-hydroxy-3-methylglutaryl-CoA synthase-like enzyme PksG